MCSIRCQRSTVDRSRIAQFALDPRTGEVPIADDCVRRDAQDFGDLLDSQAAEEAQFEHSTLALVHLREALQRKIDSHALFDLFRSQNYGCVDGNADSVAAALL